MAVATHGKLVKVDLITRWSPGVEDGQKVTGGDGEMVTSDATRPKAEPRMWTFDASPKELLKLQGLKIVFYQDAITLADIDIGYVQPGQKITWSPGATIQRAIKVYEQRVKEGRK